MTRIELACMLDRFVGDTPGCGEWEWDDFVSVEAETELEPFRQRLLLTQNGNDFDLIAIRQIIGELKN